ncbi:MAG: TRAP transporter substrate-binding protein [Spirochaetaceae bacterium]|jgi:tripartite ATP-independent transporter DctP family solute receptor|nr:TRAP transporter substrate-binding protein [Spirochaetaceae bacterium]
MKKILFVSIALLAVLASCAKKSDRPGSFRFADAHPDGYPTVLGDLRFAEIVKEKSGGSIVIEVFNNGVLGDEKSAIEQTQIGDIHFIRVPTTLLSAINPVMNALSMPYLYRDAAHMFRVLDGPIGDEFLTSLTGNNLLGLCWFDAGSRNFYNSKREVRTPADMSGLKIRVQETPLMMDLVSSLGASPTPMAYSEIYAGIQNGVIEGAENNWPSYMSQSHNEVAKFFTEDAHTRSPELILVNNGLWEKFTDEERSIIKAAALEAAAFERKEWAKQESEYKQKALSSGTVVTTLEPAQFQLFVDAVAPIYTQSAYAAYTETVNRVRATE